MTGGALTLMPASLSASATPMSASLWTAAVCVFPSELRYSTLSYTSCQPKINNAVWDVGRIKITVWNVKRAKLKSWTPWWWSWGSRCPCGPRQEQPPLAPVWQTYLCPGKSARQSECLKRGDGLVWSAFNRNLPHMIWNQLETDW